MARAQGPPCEWLGIWPVPSPVPCACPHVDFRASPVSGWQPPRPEGPEGLEPPTSQPWLGRAFLRNGQAGCWLGWSPESARPDGSSGEARSAREAAPEAPTRGCCLCWLCRAGLPSWGEW